MTTNITEAFKLHEEEGKNIRMVDWLPGEYVTCINREYFETNMRPGPIKIDYNCVIGRWEILKEPLTVNDYEKAIEWIHKNCSEEISCIIKLRELQAGIRFWEAKDENNKI